MSFQLLTSLKKFAKDFLSVDISEDVNDVDAMATINDAAVALQNSQNEKIAKVADMQNEFATLQTAVQTLTENHQKQMTELNAKIDKLGVESAKSADQLRSDLAAQIAQEKVEGDDAVKVVIGDDKSKSKVAEIKAFGKNEPLKIKIG